MFLHRIKSEGLAAVSYLVGSGGGAVVIDPRRDCDVYLELAARHGAHIEAVLETHRHEDFVVGSRELCERTGAEVFHGADLDFGYGRPASDGFELEIGPLSLRAMHTPGHTQESLSFVATDQATGPRPVAAFTGDTLFVGSTGRLDLFAGGGHEREAAAALHRSIFGRLLELGDEVMVMPAHTGGSVCGADIAERELTTIGIERHQSPALAEPEPQRWIDQRSAEQAFKPPYFARMEAVNLRGAPVTGGVPRPRLLLPREFERAMQDAVVLDVREPHAWSGAHVHGAYNVWLEGLAPYAGYVLPYDRPLLLVVSAESQLEEAARSLYRLGFDRISGYLAAGQELSGYLATGIARWYGQALPIGRSGVTDVHELAQALEHERYHVLDVRSESEWASGHIRGAQHIYVGELERRAGEVPRDREVAVHCSIGHRSGVAASILQRAGVERVTNVLGGMNAWQAAGYPLER